jgi:hypothetical protein
MATFTGGEICAVIQPDNAAMAITPAMILIFMTLRMLDFAIVCRAQALLLGPKRSVSPIQFNSTPTATRQLNGKIQRFHTLIIAKIRISGQEKTLHQAGFLI